MAEIASTEQTGRTEGPTRGRRVGRRALVVAGTVAATALVWAVGEPLLGHDLVVTSPGKPTQDLGLSAPVVVALGAGLLGWAALAVLERITARALLIWTIAALVILAASFLPLTGVEASGGSKVVLALMHVAVAAVLIPGLRRTSSRARAAR
jgi:hypothetical protein